MTDEKKITIVNDEGKSVEVNLITILTLEKYNSTYLVYSEKELTEGDNDILFSKMAEENGEPTLVDITSQEELNDLIQEFNKELKKNE